MAAEGVRVGIGAGRGKRKLPMTMERRNWKTHAAGLTKAALDEKLATLAQTEFGGNACNGLGFL